MAKRAETQLELSQDRGRQLRLLCEAEIGTPTEKLFLMVIDNRLGQWGPKKLELPEVANWCRISLKSSYRIQAVLVEIGVLVAVPVGGRCFRYSIGWNRLQALQDEAAGIVIEKDETGESDAVVAISETGSRLTSETTGLTHETARLTSETKSLTHETGCLTSETHIRNIAFNTASSAFNPPPPCAPEKAVVMDELQGCGITDTEAVDAALANGWTIEHIGQTVAFWRSQRPAWDGGALVKRFRRPGTHKLRIGDGWPETKVATMRPPHSEDPLESRFGRELDELPDVEKLLDVLRQWRLRDRELIAQRCPDDPRSHHEGRKLLLETMNAIERNRQQQRGAALQPCGP